MKDLMLDLETLSTEPGAMVFEVAIVPFDKGGVLPGGLHVNFNPASGVIDVDTVKWWMKHSEACTLGKSGMGESEAASKIQAYLADNKDSRLWAMPPAFDCIILQEFLNRNGYGPNLPISFRLWRDLRTVRELASWPETPKRPGHTTHNAHDDCVRQIDTLTECWRLLRSGANVEGKK